MARGLAEKPQPSSSFDFGRFSASRWEDYFEGRASVGPESKIELVQKLPFVSRGV